MNIPEIRFRNSWLLVNALKELEPPYFQTKEGAGLLDTDWVESRAQEYKKAWKPYEERLLEGMCDTLGLHFKQNTIDIYVAPFGHAYSDPMVISTKLDADRTVEVITHEILHRLLTDNTSWPGYEGLNEKWQELFGSEHTFNTLIHIPVHAMLKYLFVDVLNEPERYKRDVEKCSAWPDYRAAWDYVNKNNYQLIIDDLKKMYTKN